MARDSMGLTPGSKMSPQHVSQSVIELTNFTAALKK
jgi:hypothetical protein